MSHWREDVAPVAAMATLFIVSILLAMALAPTFDQAGVRVFEDEEDLVNPLIYLGIVVAFTVVILVIARLGLERVIQFIILGAVFLTILYVLQPILDLALPPVAALGLSVAVGSALVLALFFYPEWYIVDAVGVLVSAGAAAIFGVSLAVVPALLLLVGFALYDAIAVYRTRHMLDLADSVLELRLPIMFVVPRHMGYSFLAERRRIKDPEEGTERDAMFMGLGDVVIPAVLVVSAMTNLPHVPGILGMPGPLVVAAATLLGVLAGYGLLMAFVLRGNPQAGLPSLNGGAILGFLVALVPLYGLAPIVDPITALFG